MARIGVLALQGGFAAHREALRRLSHQPTEVRESASLEQIEGLILPGGESTTQLKLIDSVGLGPALQRFVDSGRPLLVTCAGLILAARRVQDPAQPSFGWLDVVVRRNAYGRQLDSFEGTSDGGLPLVFIRAPRIAEWGSAVEVLDCLEGEPIWVRQGAVLGATFHPELTDSLEVHRRAFGRG